MTVEDLFEAELRLRAAACNYAVQRTEDTRCSLRAAAVKYAAVADAVGARITRLTVLKETPAP